MLQDIINKIEAENYLASSVMKQSGLKPCVCIINANISDEPSLRYIRNKVKKLESEGIGVELVQLKEDCTVGDIEAAIHANANDDTVTSIILQLPLKKEHKKYEKKLLCKIPLEKDIDRLNPFWFYDKDPNNLPLTAYGIFRMLEDIISNCDRKKVLFYGNGETTNRRLFPFVFDKGIVDTAIINSKTSENEVERLIDWADIIIAATGIPEILDCSGKIVISPTIAKTENGFRGDLKEECRHLNETHSVIGAIGKLTVSELIRRAYMDCGGVK